MSTFDWQDVLMDEDEGLPVPAAKEDLPTDNEKEGEDNGFDSPAAGDLPEEEDPDGMKDVPRGKDPISGNDSKDYDDQFLDSFLDEDDAEKKDDEEKSDDEGEDDKKEEKEDKKDEEDEEPADDKDVKDSSFSNLFQDEEGGLPVPAPKEDLPDENEKEGEDNGFDSPAAGDLPEDDTDPGMKDVPRGEDPITHMTSKEYDDLINFYADKEDEDKEEKEDDKEEKEDEGEDKKDQGEDKGSDDDGASKDEPVEGDEEVKDFADFFVDGVGEKTPDADGAGADLKPADPVDGDGKKVDPIGDPDLPSNLTEPVLVPADDPGTKDEMLDILKQDARFSFGDF